METVHATVELVQSWEVRKAATRTNRLGTLKTLPDDIVRLRAQKNHSWVSVAVPESTARMIQERARGFGPYIFGNPSGRKPDNITGMWRDRLEQLWEESGPWEHKRVA
jgi:hypothetical protein